MQEFMAAIDARTEGTKRRTRNVANDRFVSVNRIDLRPFVFCQNHRGR